ncbi:MAG: aminopeptidase [Flavobacteriales bacterium]|nr:aminopeptidase [Flavobacteriales bacterium]
MKKILGAILLSAFTLTINAQEKETEYKFNSIVNLDATVIKSQGRTGTCWSFSTSSFLESEILRITGKTIDLSEMYNARIAYPQKAKNYIGRSGKAQFSEGGLNHDVMTIIKQDGLVPEDAYAGKLVNKDRYDHAELSYILETYLNAILEKKGGTISPVWENGFEGILDAYLGEVPEEFKFEGKEYSPESFRDAMKINPDDYIQFTSFQAYPYNSKVILNIPDNWSNGSYYNLELNEYEDLVINALKNGYTVAIDSDVSEKTFSSKYGMAIVPATDINTMSNEDKSKLFKEPVEEMIITPELRQQEFYNGNTTDDHLMHITGLLKDQNGTMYFKVKNSWGTNGQGHEGNVYFSEAFFKLKSISVMMHKDAVQKKLKKKLGIK